ncbi:hypothetical protein K435DRAFT_803314 [Dendrothele bispora CBS 962.96]|uniref:Uncharacterized protein n=1 Tax=Dendrothele bispora (strain CBS 962.96) TaxID=1314807 RepID=A0A4S8KTI8_DENBC|nr:hypothetical protein K435DRAFT_811031 [Dendrothele bispora CBS 962.96]THU88701.1 hypothetical protein K435DRAFT_803314 [Dendrothele bispora CBS 962.96]
MIPYFLNYEALKGRVNLQRSPNRGKGTYVHGHKTGYFDYITEPGGYTATAVNVVPETAQPESWDGQDRQVDYSKYIQGPRTSFTKLAVHAIQFQESNSDLRSSKQWDSLRSSVVLSTPTTTFEVKNIFRFGTTARRGLECCGTEITTNEACNGTLVTIIGDTMEVVVEAENWEVGFQVVKTNKMKRRGTKGQSLSEVEEKEKKKDSGGGKGPKSCCLRIAGKRV